MKYTAAFLSVVIALLTGACGNTLSNEDNLHDLPSDLDVPGVTDDEPGPGKRVWEHLPEYDGWDVAHAVYLPTDWEEGKSYPVIFEYPGNGGFSNERGDRSDGRVENCLLGYGLTAGKGVIWVSMPFVDSEKKQHSIRWWGETEETVRYCKLTVKQICDKFGGDPDRLLIAGFSRGAIACNYIGLWDDEIAALWCGFFPHSHYDGVHLWGYAGSDRASAQKRLARLGTRPQWISHEQSIDDVKSYLEASDSKGQFHMVVLPYPNHSPRWVLKEMPIRNEARIWLNKVLEIPTTDTP